MLLCTANMDMLQCAAKDTWHDPQPCAAVQCIQALRARQSDLEGDVGPSPLLRLQAGPNRQVPSCRVPTHAQAPLVAAKLTGMGCDPADRCICIPVSSWELVLRRKPAGRASKRLAASIRGASCGS